MRGSKDWRSVGGGGDGVDGVGGEGGAGGERGAGDGGVGVVDGGGGGVGGGGPSTLRVEKVGQFQELAARLELQMRSKTVMRLTQSVAWRWTCSPLKRR